MKKKICQRIVTAVAIFTAFIATFAFFSCEDTLFNEPEIQSGKPILLTGSLQQQNLTRANEQGFVTGDRMGVYIVDYVDGKPGELHAESNRASNLLYTFDGDYYKWSATTSIFWKDNTTAVDVFGYYPGVNYIDNPAEYDIIVSDKQNLLPAEDEMSNYEASDFLWGKATNVEPTTEEIVIKYTHRMAGVWVTLVAGEGISATEWEKLPKIVQVDNTVRSATVNLATGIPVAEGNVDVSIAMLQQGDNGYRAVVVPQTVAAGKSLLSITIDGTTYRHKLTADMTYQTGKMHNFTVTVNRSEASGEFELEVVDGGITPWVNDEVSHQFSTQAYVVIDCPEAGKLKKSITNAGYDYKEVQNLKITGKLNSDDFSFINKEMTSLKHLNLKETKVWTRYDNWQDDKVWYVEDELPGGAFYGNKYIRSIILPTSLKRIGGEAFRESHLMYSTLEIPEGVTYLGVRALQSVEHNGVELILPSTLDSICSLAFYDCKYSCEFKMSDNIKYMGTSMVYNGNGVGAPNFHGVFNLPSGLKEINGQVFCGLGSNGSFTGDIIIPQGITSIGDKAFDVSLKNRVNLSLPAGVKRIGEGAFGGGQWGNHRIRFNSISFNNDLQIIEKAAFYGCKIPFQIELPEDLMSIGEICFYNCGIEGELVIPEGCLDIGSNAFARCNLTKLTLPSKLEDIKHEAFQSVGRITEITIPKYVEWIGDKAFADNRYLQTVISLNPEPPTINENVFEGVSMDKAVLQVPEQSVELYRNTDGWKEFKNITAYCELAFNIPEIVCLDKGVTRNGILRTQGAWEVVECPDWVTVTPASGTDKKEELAVTVDEQPAGSATREGRIVFRLKDKDYTTYTTVRQVGGDVAENETFILQEATAGAAKAIPLFIVGDGYNADDIASGKYLKEVREQMEHFFSIEPMKSYRNYFTVSTAVAVSPESGISGLTKFDTKDFGGNDNKVMDYACKYGVGINGNEGNSTVMVLLNTNMTSNRSSLHANGLSISYIGKSTDVYPFNQQGYVLHEVVGRGFGKLAPESINHFTFIKSCSCPGCNMMSTYNEYKGRDWWQNVSITSKMSDLPWSHLVFDERYAQYVDVYEGGLDHSRGVYRSENMSVMGNQFVPYFNTISREILVRRIMQCAGERFIFEDFVAKDKLELPEELKTE